jgi:2'-hydroxyisoflavone reductase
VDARDLAAFVVQASEDVATGTFNATGPEKTLTMKRLLESVRKAASNPASLTWVPEKFLEEHKVSAWQDMPVWAGAGAGFTQIDCRKAIGKGLRFRAPEETAKDTLAWWKTLPEDRRSKLRAGLSADREKEVLAAWKARKA